MTEDSLGYMLALDTSSVSSGVSPDEAWKCRSFYLVKDLYNCYTYAVHKKKSFRCTTLVNMSWDEKRSFSQPECGGVDASFGWLCLNGQNWKHCTLGSNHGRPVGPINSVTGIQVLKCCPWYLEKAKQNIRSNPVFKEHGYMFNLWLSQRSGICAPEKHGKLFLCLIAFCRCSTFFCKITIKVYRSMKACLISSLLILVN